MRHERLAKRVESGGGVAVAVEAWVVPHVFLLQSDAHPYQLIVLVQCKNSTWTC